MQQSRNINVQVMPLNVSSGMKIVGEGAFQQKYSRDDNAFYPSYSSILPLVITIPVNLQDPDGVVPSGPATLDRADWYTGEYKPVNKIVGNNPNYEIATIKGVPVIKIKRNTPVDEPFLLIGEAFYTNTKTGRQESRIEQRLLSSIYYEASLLSLMSETSTEVIVDPTKIDDTNPANWYVTLKAILKSGELNLTDNNAAYWWYVQDGKYTRLVTTSDAWLITSPNSDGTYPRILTVDASRFKNLKLECRAAYKGAAESAPSSPTNSALLAQYNIRVDLPVFQNAKQIPIAGAYITIKDINTNKAVKSRCEITAAGRIIDNPQKYYNIAWKATNADGSSFIAGYGEDIDTTVKALGITYTNPVILEPIVLPKIGSWNVEGSVYSGIGATPAFRFGVNQIADKLGAYLIKCEDGVNVEIIGKLRNNNWMRFEDGSPAPTMINSASEDKGYNIMYGWTQTVHTIENAMVGSEVVALFSEEPFEYNGLQSRPIPPTLISPGLPTLAGGKFRTMYFNYNAGTGGNNGMLGITAFNNPNRTYPKTGISQLTTDNYSVAHNADKTKTMPFAPLMDWHLLNITNALMNKFGTVCLHDINMFGAGISSNISYTHDNAAVGYTHVWYKMSEGDAAIYNKLSEQPQFCVDNKGTKKHWNQISSNEYPRMKCLETQMALSHAVEQNIQPGVDFVFDGETYSYSNVEGCKGLLEGEMNARLVKKIYLTDLPAFDTSGNPINVKSIGIILQTSAVYGMDLVSADVFQYAGSGIEKVLEIEDITTSPTNPLKCYLCTQQDKLTLNKSLVKESGELFDFESNGAYEYIGMLPPSSGYFAGLIRGTRLGMEKKGGLMDNTAYIDRSNSTGQALGKRARVGHRVRGYGPWTVASARSLFASYQLSSPSATFAGGFQVRLPDGAQSATTLSVSDESE